MKFTIAATALLATIASASPVCLSGSSSSDSSSASSGNSTSSDSGSTSGSTSGSSTGSATDACDVGYCTQNGGTTGGAAGTTVTVTDLDSLTEYAEADEAYTIIVSGEISGSAQIRVGSDKTIYGESGSSITGVGFYISEVSNVIMRNLKIAKVPADNGDAIGIQASTNVWVDHCDVSGDLSAGKDDYDGLVDVTHASEWVTISNTYFHDHWKASLVGHSDSNADEDTGTFHITYANNYWSNINSRCPSLRFATAHIINNYYEGILTTGINTRMGTEVYVESSAFADSADEAITFEDSDETGYAVVDDVDLGSSSNSAPEGTISLSDFPYDTIEPLGSDALASTIPTTAGQTL
ncbi:pectate lyase A precursor [Pseudomassariella vexata]|uniref:pectate lyase n=1 Tax=Pseudomassariella vexata TaxID=1141098 RepID=A0A1Y2DBH8_9PEZI|nr:pectate lyase A precursor [Pseudomassariella vexata]ORY56633.1 pectate lyase A precursor [Pseudomassariella vexata]